MKQYIFERKLYKDDFELNVAEFISKTYGLSELKGKLVVRQCMQTGSATIFPERKCGLDRLPVRADILRKKIIIGGKA